MLKRFEKSDIDSAYELFAEFCTRLGFKKKRKNLFIRPAEDQIKHAICLNHFIKYGELHVSISLCVFHDGIRAIVNEGMPRHPDYKVSSKNGQLDDTLDVSVPKFIIARQTGKGAVSDYTISAPEEVENVMAQVFRDTEQVIHDYFSLQETIQGLIVYFQKTPRAGGTAHWVKLMAMLFYAGRLKELRNLIIKLESELTVPITEKMIAYMQKKIASEARAQ